LNYSYIVDEDLSISEWSFSFGSWVASDGGFSIFFIFFSRFEKAQGFIFHIPTLTHRDVFWFWTDCFYDGVFSDASS
jgi:hypothetical protein